MQDLFIVWKTGKMETKKFNTKVEADSFVKENSDKIRHTEISKVEKGATNMETAKKFMDGNLYKGYYIVSAKKCEHAESNKGFSIFKVQDGQPIWDEVDGEIINMNLAKTRVDMLSALTPKKQEPISIIKQDDLVPMPGADMDPIEGRERGRQQSCKKPQIDEYLFGYIPQKHKDSIEAIYKDGKIYTAVLTNGKTVTNITNWDSFKRAIRRAIEG